MSPLTLEQETAVVAQIARSAGEILMDVYATDFTVEFKDRGDPVTVADRRANRHIVGELQKLFPGDQIVSEEEPADVGHSQRARVWYVDPLDGTQQFISRIDEFAVMIGLAVDGNPRAGVVYQPSRDVLYAGVVGRGAWIENRRTGRRPLSVLPRAGTDGLRLAVSRAHRSPLIDRMGGAIGVCSELTSGSVGLKIGLIAEGQADLYIEPSDGTSLWDTCAPEAVLLAAGGRSTDLCGDPIRYDVGAVRNLRGVFASNSACHERILEIIAPIARSGGVI